MALTPQEQAVTDSAALVVSGIFGFLPASSEVTEIEGEFITKLATLEGNPPQTVNEFVTNVCNLANASAALSGNSEAIKIVADLTKTVQDAAEGKTMATVADLIRDFVDIKSAIKKA